MPQKDLCPRPVPLCDVRFLSYCHWNLSQERNDRKYRGKQDIRASIILSRVLKRICEIRHVLAVSENYTRQKRQNISIYCIPLLLQYFGTFFTCDIIRAKPVTECDKTPVGHRTGGSSPYTASNLALEGVVQWLASPTHIRTERTLGVRSPGIHLHPGQFTVVFHAWVRLAVLIPFRL